MDILLCVLTVSRTDWQHEALLGHIRRQCRYSLCSTGYSSLKPSRAIFLPGCTILQSTFVHSWHVVESSWLTLGLMQDYGRSSCHCFTSKRRRACCQRKWQWTMRALGSSGRRLSEFLSCTVFFFDVYLFVWILICFFIILSCLFFGYLLLGSTETCNIVLHFSMSNILFALNSFAWFTLC